jgi:D-alanyl-D-alanine endopeptidase (penicillin-binding protein 7)
LFFKIKERHLKRLFIATSLGVLASLCSVHIQAAPNQKKPTVQKSKPAGVNAHLRRAKVLKVSPVAIPSFGQKAGLHGTSDMLDLKSSVAYVIDQDTHEVLISKNDNAVLPIASITKLMTGLIISEAKLPMEESITITQDDVDTEKGSSSR